MDYGFIAEHGARHRRGQRDIGASGDAGDKTGIGDPLFGRLACNHPGIAGRFLVAPQREPAIAAERIEPVQRKQRLHRNVDQQVLAIVVRQLVRQGEITRDNVVLRHETFRQRDDRIENAERKRCLRSRRFDEAYLPRATDFASAFEQLSAQLEIAPEPQPEKDGSADQPYRASDLHQRCCLEKG